MPEKVSVVTLGCEKILIDSEIISGLVHQRGFKLVEKPEDATTVIVNACGFIDATKEESLNTILNLAETNATATLKALIVSGCFTHRYKQASMHQMPEIHGLIATGDFHKIDAPDVDGALYTAGCLAEIGEIRRVRITHASEYDLSGEAIA
jgi:ribosomal protein S12 methylthiotransferase